MPLPRRCLRLGAALAATAISLSLAAGTATAVAPVKKPKKQSVEGKISWTIWTTYHEEGDPMSGTWRDESREENYTLQVNAVRDPKFTRTYKFKRSKAPYTYTNTASRVSKERSMGQFTCESTTTESASGTGSVDISPDVFGKYNPNRDVLVIDRRTKGISLPATMHARGESTTTQKGFGTNPCGDSTWTDPVAETGGTFLMNANWKCLPNGLKSVAQGQKPLFGKWNNKKKRFDFQCTQTFEDGAGMTQKISVTGSLKYRR